MKYALYLTLVVSIFHSHSSQAEIDLQAEKIRFCKSDAFTKELYGRYACFLHFTSACNLYEMAMVDTASAVAGAGVGHGIAQLRNRIQLDRVARELAAHETRYAAKAADIKRIEGEIAKIKAELEKQGYGSTNELQTRIDRVSQQLEILRKHKEALRLAHGPEKFAKLDQLKTEAAKVGIYNLPDNATEVNRLMHRMDLERGQLKGAILAHERINGLEQTLPQLREQIAKAPQNGGNALAADKARITANHPKLRARFVKGGALAGVVVLGSLHAFGASSLLGGPCVGERAKTKPAEKANGKFRDFIVDTGCGPQLNENKIYDLARLTEAQREALYRECPSCCDFALGRYEKFGELAERSAPEWEIDGGDCKTNPMKVEITLDKSKKFIYEIKEETEKNGTEKSYTITTRAKPGVPAPSGSEQVMLRVSSAGDISAPVIRFPLNEPKSGGIYAFDKMKTTVDAFKYIIDAKEEHPEIDFPKDDEELRIKAITQYAAARHLIALNYALQPVLGYCKGVRGDERSRPGKAEGADDAKGEGEPEFERMIRQKSGP